MPTLHDELLADQKPNVQCKVCRFLLTLSPDDREEWEAEIALPKAIIHHSTIVRAIAKRCSNKNDIPSPDSVADHRSKHVRAA